MVKALLAIVRKELLEMVRDPKFIVGLVISFALLPLIGVFVSGAMVSATTAATKTPLAVVDLDSTEYSKIFLDCLRKAGCKIEVVNVPPAVAIDNVKRGYMQALLIIDRGFGENLSRGLKGSVELYISVRSLTMSDLVHASTVEQLVGVAERLMARKLAARLTQYSPDVIFSPVKVGGGSIVRGYLVNAPPTALAASAMGLSFAVPFSIMAVLVFVIQMAATSMALEKENKTLELLLTQPVGRVTILVGKLIASTILALMGTVVYGAGIAIYLSMIMSVPSSAPSAESTHTVSLASIAHITGIGVVMLLLVIALTMVSALSLAVIIGAFAEDVRGANSLAGALIPLVLVPTMAAAFVDVNNLPLLPRVALLAIPYTHTMLATQAVFFNDIRTLAIAAAYLAVFTIASLYIAAKLFLSERVLTTRLGGRRRRRAK